MSLAFGSSLLHAPHNLLSMTLTVGPNHTIDPAACVLHEQQEAYSPFWKRWVGVSHGLLWRASRISMALAGPWEVPFGERDLSNTTNHSLPPLWASLQRSEWTGSTSHWLLTLLPLHTPVTLLCCNLHHSQGRGAVMERSSTWNQQLLQEEAEFPKRTLLVVATAWHASLNSWRWVPICLYFLACARQQ